MTNGKTDIAAGRAYYAMFYVAEALLNEKGFQFGKHSNVLSAYGQHFAKTKVLDPKYHRWLITAFDQRQVGDYAFDPDVQSNVIVEMIHRRKNSWKRRRNIWAQNSPYPSSLTGSATENSGKINIRFRKFETGENMTETVLQVRSNGQITLPSGVRRKANIKEGDLLEIVVEADGTLRLVPQIAVNRSQAYFWTRRWQEGEHEADDDLIEGRFEDFSSMEDLIADLGKDTA